MNPVVLLHGNVRKHKGGSWNNAVTLSPYCPYIPDLTFTDSHLKILLITTVQHNKQMSYINFINSRTTCFGPYWTIIRSLRVKI